MGKGGTARGVLLTIRCAFHGQVTLRILPSYTIATATEHISLHNSHVHTKMRSLESGDMWNIFLFSCAPSRLGRCRHTIYSSNVGDWITLYVMLFCGRDHQADKFVLDVEVFSRWQDTSSYLKQEDWMIYYTRLCCTLLEWSAILLTWYPCWV